MPIDTSVSDSIYPNLLWLCRLSGHKVGASGCFVEQTDPVLSHTDTKIVGITKLQDHCSFAICVKTETDQFVLNKRYSEFRRFRDDMIRCCSQGVGCGVGPCRHLKGIAKGRFPKKQLRVHQEEIARNRIKDLDRFLSSILTSFKTCSRRNQRLCEQKQCVLFELVMQFLKLDELELQLRDSARGSASGRNINSVSRQKLYPITENCEVCYDVA